MLCFLLTLQHARLRSPTEQVFRLDPPADCRPTSATRLGDQGEPFDTNLLRVVDRSARFRVTQKWLRLHDRVTGVIPPTSLRMGIQPC